MANTALSTPPGGLEDVIVALAQVGIKTRKQIENHIEWLISFLDRQDGDENLEPSLGWTGAIDQDSAIRFGNTMTDESEPNGDEIDTSFTEDEFYGHWTY